MRHGNSGRRQAAWGVVVCVIGMFILACGGDSPPTSDVFGRAPWPASESLDYDVKTDKGELLGKEVLRVETSGGETVLTQLFTAAERRDQSSVRVQSADLKPIASLREIVTPNDDERIEVVYTEAGAQIKQGERQTGLSVPEHSYDNDTSLFLWRTLPFAEGYEAAYNTIITNFRSRQTVVLRVTGRETVRVPAGEFQAWRLEVRTSNANQVAWFADTAARTLVKYDNDRGVIFELTSRP